MADRVYPLLFHERMLSVSPEWLLYHWPLTTDKTEEKLRGKPIHLAFVSAVPHWMVNPVELSREAQGHPRSIFAIARRVWVHTDIGVRIYICSNSAISVRIAGDSNHRSKRCKCSWKGYVNRTAGKINSGSPLDRKACGIITCLAKTNRNPKDFIWVCSIAATQIKVRVWVWICPDIASAIASQNSNNTIKNRKSFRKCYISRTAPRKVGARAPLDRKACGVITWLS